MNQLQRDAEKLDPDELVALLRSAREKLCRAQVLVDPTDSATLQGALDRVDLVACDLPGWSRHNGGRRG